MLSPEISEIPSSSLSQKQNNLALYIHWPFCQAKCPYCDFNSHVREQIDHHSWHQAYLREIAFWAEKMPKARLNSIFFGGGTPSLMQPHYVAELISTARQYWSVQNGVQGDIQGDVEITLEANPGTVDRDRLQAFRQAGVNRLSIGVQSFHDKNLEFLGRHHSARDAEQALYAAAEVFDHYSFDLIYALPGQTIQNWQTDLTQSLKFQSEHLSLYQLTIEPQTAFYRAVATGQWQEMDNDEQANFYETTCNIMHKAGRSAYEVSNYALPMAQCRHNVAIWRGSAYLGVGPGAHGRLHFAEGWYSQYNTRSPEKWLTQTQEKGSGCQDINPIEAVSRAEEIVLTNLRLTEGVCQESFVQCTGIPLDSLLNGERCQQLIEAGLLEDNARSLRATPQGLLCLNAVLDYILSRKNAAT